MEEFFRENYSVLSIVCTFIAAVSGLISYNKYKETAATFFIKILVFLFIVELVGFYSSCYKYFSFLEPVYNSVFRQNYWWYTLSFDVMAIVLFSMLFQKVILNKVYTNILKYGTYCFVLFSLVYLIYNRDVFFFQFFPVIQILGAFIILSCSVFYFIELLLSENILRFYKSVYFYIAIAIFIWWIVVTPLTFYDVYMVNSDWNYIILKWQIYLSLNFFMYVLFSVGLFVSKPVID